MSTPTWTPSEAFARHAPALVCNVASRIVWLRRKAKDLPPEIQRELAPFLATMPFEAELLSGKIEEIESIAQKMESSLLTLPASPL